MRCCSYAARYEPYAGSLRELIVAVTDEILPFVRDPSRLNLVGSYVLTFRYRAIDSWLASGSQVISLLHLLHIAEFKLLTTEFC